MRIEQLRYLIHVAESGSISRSAKALNISQQGLSQSIHQLERELGVRMFYRDGNRTRLTAAGSLVIGSMARMVEDWDRICARLVSNAIHLNQDERQVCRVRITPHFGIAVMPAILQRMSRSHPDLLLSVEEGSILEILQRDTFDTDEVFILTCPEKLLPQLLDKPGVLAFRESSRGTVHAALQPSHPLAGRERITVDDLCTYPLALLGAIHPLRNLMGSRFQQANIRLHTTNYELFRAASSLKNMISLSVPLACDREDSSRLVYVPVEDSETILFGYVENRYTRGSEIARELLGMMERELSGMELRKK